MQNFHGEGALGLPVVDVVDFAEGALAERGENVEVARSRVGVGEERLVVVEPMHEGVE